jgi:hypothetical protein
MEREMLAPDLRMITSVQRIGAQRFAVTMPTSDRIDIVWQIIVREHALIAALLGALLDESDAVRRQELFDDVRVALVTHAVREADDLDALWPDALRDDEHDVAHGKVESALRHLAAELHTSRWRSAAVVLHSEVCAHFAREQAVLSASMADAASAALLS